MLTKSSMSSLSTTRIAAVDIGACTLHSWAGLPSSQPKDDDWLDQMTKASEEKRRVNIQGKEFLIVDESPWKTR